MTTLTEMQVYRVQMTNLIILGVYNGITFKFALWIDFDVSYSCIVILNNKVGLQLRGIFHPETVETSLNSGTKDFKKCL